MQISTESSIRAAQERSKKSVTGRLKEIACAEIDEQTENLVASLGDTQVDYRFFLGFKLVVTDKDADVVRAARNLPSVTTISSDLINVYDIVANEKFVATQAAVNKIEEAYKA